jgi:hypothetical protein
MGSRSTLDCAVSEFSLRGVQQDVESGCTKQAVQVDGLDTVEVHDAYVLDSGASQHLQNELTNTPCTNN